MKVKEKLEMDYEGLVKNGPVTIVAFGDSVTHGAVGFDEINYETVYWNRLRQKLNAYRNYVPVNVIDAGIGGITAAASLDRMEWQVFAHHPDLVIICFGLNDVNSPLEEYLGALGSIFDRCREEQTEAVFMTPNMLNTYVPDMVRGSEFEQYAAHTAELQNNGTMDRYMSATCRLAEEKGIAVCDCYSGWKELSQTEDTTKLLANGINHPVREMHELFAEELYYCIMGEASCSKCGNTSTMYRR